MTDNFRDFVVVVTSAAGGVGSAVSSWLLAQGARVFDLDRRPPEPLGGEFVAVDVRDPAAVNGAIEEVVDRAGRIDGLVVAAGLSEEPTPEEEMIPAIPQRPSAVPRPRVALSRQTLGT